MCSFEGLSSIYRDSENMLPASVGLKSSDLAKLSELSNQLIKWKNA